MQGDCVVSSYTYVLCAMAMAGFKPYKVTHSSDSFQRLYDLAVELIKRWVSPCVAGSGVGTEG